MKIWIKNTILMLFLAGSTPIYPMNSVPDFFKRNSWLSKDNLIKGANFGCIALGIGGTFYNALKGSLGFNKQSLLPLSLLALGITGTIKSQRKPSSISTLNTINTIPTPSPVPIPLPVFLDDDYKAIDPYKDYFYNFFYHNHPKRRLTLHAARNDSACFFSLLPIELTQIIVSMVPSISSEITPTQMLEEFIFSLETPEEKEAFEKLFGKLIKSDTNNSSSPSEVIKHANYLFELSSIQQVRARVYIDNPLDTTRYDLDTDKIFLENLNKIRIAIKCPNNPYMILSTVNSFLTSLETIKENPDLSLLYSESATKKYLGIILKAYEKYASQPSFLLANIVLNLLQLEGNINTHNAIEELLIPKISHLDLKNFKKKLEDYKQQNSTSNHTIEEKIILITELLAKNPLSAQTVNIAVPEPTFKQLIS